MGLQIVRHDWVTEQWQQYSPLLACSVLILENFKSYLMYKSKSYFCLFYFRPNWFSQGPWHLFISLPIYFPHCSLTVFFFFFFKTQNSDHVIYNLTSSMASHCSLKIFIYIFNFWPRSVACGFLALQPGVEPTYLHWKHEFNHWTTRIVTYCSVLIEWKIL